MVLPVVRLGVVTEEKEPEMCDTVEERMAINEEFPCDAKFRSVFPVWMAGYVSPAILFLGMTIIGFGISTRKPWLTKFLPSAGSQLGIISMLLCADLSSSYFDHTRVSSEEFCLTSSLPGNYYDTTKSRAIFGGIGVAIAAAAVYGMRTGSIVMSAAGIPAATLCLYQAWAPHTFKSCRNSSNLTGLLANSLDVMTLVGVLQAVFAASGNTDTSWHTATNIYAAIVSVLFVVLTGFNSEYPKRVDPAKGCLIDDADDIETEKNTSRLGELVTGVCFSVVSMVYFVYLLKNFKEVSCCAIHPALGFLAFDIFLKISNWKQGEASVGNAVHRAVVYSLVQVLDVILSSQAMLSLGVEKGLLKAGIPGSQTNVVKKVGQLATGSVSYVLFVVRLIGSLISGTSVQTSTLARLAEIVKLISLNIGGNLVPLYLDSVNMSYMAYSSPREMNTTCNIK